MSEIAKNSRAVRCTCGNVEFNAIGDPIVSVVCYCDDCQAGGHTIEALPNAQAVVDPDGGTPFDNYRKDRFRCVKGEPLLKNHKIRDDSPTNRVVATCCNSMMMMTFDDSKHWIPVHRARLQGTNSPLQMRIATKFKPEGSVIPMTYQAIQVIPSNLWQS